MVSHRHQRQLAFILLAILVAAAPSRGQQQQPIAEIFSDVVEVRVVNIEVVVTDRQGNRVTGLSSDDFILKVDGEEVPIDYFSEIRERTAVESAEGVSAVPSLEPGSRVGTSYLVYVDDLFSIPRDRDRVLDHIREQLGELGENDRLAMVAFDGKRLQNLTAWTNSPLELDDAFRRAKARPAYGAQRLSELRTNDAEREDRRFMGAATVDRIVSAGGEPPPAPFMENRLAGPELAYANRLQQQVESSVLAAVSALRSFAAPPGRKVMLLLSGGWPNSPGEYTINDYYQTPDGTAAGAVDTRFKYGRELFAPLTDTANLLSYTIYPVDVPGPNRRFAGEASQPGPGFPIAGEPGASNLMPRELLVHDALHIVADETGGTALLNAERDDSLAKVVADTRSFYWLGFSPDRREDDERHDIDIEVRGRRGLKVRAREGFVDLSRGTEVTMMVESALLFGDPPSTVPLATTFGRPTKKRGKLRIPLEVGIPMDEISLLPSQGRYVNELEIRVTVMDENGSRSDTTVDKIQINGAEPPRPGQFYYYETTLHLRNRNHRIVIAVFDPLSNAILSSIGDVTAR